MLELLRLFLKFSNLQCNDLSVVQAVTASVTPFTLVTIKLSRGAGGTGGGG